MSDAGSTAALQLGSVEALAELVVAGAEGRDRFVVGVVGPPGAGKSTVSAQLARLLPSTPPVVGMDGFHLANDVLVERGMIGRKGAPDTFDAEGFVALCERLRSTTTTIWCPRFDRTLDDSVAASVGVRPEDHIVIVEGNYLLLDVAPWDRVAALLDLTVYLDLDQAARVERLIARHVEFGKSETDARRFVETSDETNAVLVTASCARAAYTLASG